MGAGGGVGLELLDAHSATCILGAYHFRGVFNHSNSKLSLDSPSGDCVSAKATHCQHQKTA